MPTNFIYADRIKQIKQEFVEYDILPAAQMVNPEVIALFGLWDTYINLPAENHKMYDELKKKFINLLGENQFYDWLSTSRFLHQTQWLNRKGLSDITDYEEPIREI